jgi:hypothetical protein
MSQTKIEQSQSYREFLLENLRDEAHAAGYLTAALAEEDADEAFLKQLMQSAIDDVIEARFSEGEASPTGDGRVLPAVGLWRDRFAVAQSKGSDVRALVQLLDALGFQLAVVPKSGD